MKRISLSVRLAFEAIIGVVLLFNIVTNIVRWLVGVGSGPTIGMAIAACIGMALVVDAARVRRKLSALDLRITSDDDSSRN